MKAWWKEYWKNLWPSIDPRIAAIITRHIILIVSAVSAYLGFLYLLLGTKHA